MTVRMPLERGELIIAPVRLNHHKSRRRLMVMDTGSRLTSIKPETAIELGFDPGELLPTCQVVGVTGAAPASVLVLRSVSLFGLSVDMVRVACHPLPPALGIDGILGLNFLQHFNIRIDNDREMVFFEKRQGAPSA